MDLVIRHFQPDDREAVNAVAYAAFAQYQHAYQDWPGFGERLARMADLAGQADLMVAEAAGKVLGAVVHVGPGKPRSASFPDDWSLIRMLVVAPAHRGRGIGQQLLAACLRCAIRDRAPAVGLHTSPIMTTAPRLYLHWVLRMTARSSRSMACPMPATCCRPRLCRRRSASSPPDQGARNGLRSFSSSM